MEFPKYDDERTRVMLLVEVPYPIFLTGFESEPQRDKVEG